jgi:hypothetical protein
MTMLVEESGREPVTCATLVDARQYVEERAVEIWDRLRDPNADPQPFEGVRWTWDDASKTWNAVSGRTEWEVRHVNN